MRSFYSLLFLIGFTLIVSSARSQPLRLAIAANAQFVIRALQEDFKKRTGIETEAIAGSSGNLAAQIRNGAPYDMFLSADMEFPTMLYKEGIGISPPKEYASGSLVVCSMGNLDLKNWPTIVVTDAVKNLAIANPAVAPYGKAAQQVLKHYAVWDKVQSKLVFGESISQVNTYITTGTVNLGFTTEALIYEFPLKGRLRWHRIDRAVYERIRQGFVILGHSKKGNYSKAQMFSNYLLSAPAKTIFKKFGYQVL